MPLIGLMCWFVSWGLWRLLYRINFPCAILLYQVNCLDNDYLFCFTARIRATHQHRSHFTAMSTLCHCTWITSYDNVIDTLEILREQSIEIIRAVTRLV